MSEEHSQKLREYKESRIRSMFQEELQQRPEEIIEQMKKIFDRLKSSEGYPITKEILSVPKSIENILFYVFYFFEKIFFCLIMISEMVQQFFNSIVLKLKRISFILLRKQSI